MGAKQKRQLARLRQEVSRHRKRAEKADRVAAASKADAKQARTVLQDALDKLSRMSITPNHDRRRYVVQVELDEMAIAMARYPSDLAFHLGVRLAGEIGAAMNKRGL